MVAPMSWLHSMVGGLDCDVRSFMDRITKSGVKVEGLTRPGHDISGVVVGKVLSIEKHPNADKLLITQVDVGEREIQVVTGAANLTVGDYVPVALDGACLAEGKKIKKGKLRGELSEGMLCDIGELGATRSDFPEAPEDGIYVFHEPQPPGACVKTILDLEDEIVEFEIMSNRPDCNSMIGVAREAAAAYGKKFTEPEVKFVEESGSLTGDMISIEVKNEVLCPRYVARVVANVKITASPQWIRRRLSKFGIRPINNIVDITNYVMLEYGQPMHAFDITAVSEGKIIVRNAAKDEAFTTLDGVSRSLDESILVIADASKAIAIAGVMGGENSMVGENTSTVLFECANFNGPNIRKTSKKLGLRTDSSARFEKGLDPNLALSAVNRAMELISETGCGTVASGAVDVYPSPRGPKKVGYSPDKINALLGTEIEASEMIETLGNLGIETRERMSCGEYEAEIPSRRYDINREADIAEEIARLYGFDNIKSRKTHAVAKPGGRPARMAFADETGSVMRALGYSEAITYPFEDPGVFDKLLIDKNDADRIAIQILNPIGENYSIMRTVTPSGLLESLSLNISRRNECARLYEIAYAYKTAKLPPDALPEEKQFLTAAAYDKKGVGFYEIKGDAEELFAQLGLDGRVSYKSADIPNWMHPGRTASIFVDGANIGYMGEFHPETRARFKIDERAYAIVVEMDALYGFSSGVKKAFKPLPKFPATLRDIALKVKNETTAAEIEETIRKSAGQFLTGLKLFDVYQGKQIEDGYKSLAYSLTFRAADRTLSESDVAGPMDRILRDLSEKLEATLRDK